jgi:hypothetical protein
MIERLKQRFKQRWEVGVSYGIVNVILAYVGMVILKSFGYALAVSMWNFLLGVFIGAFLIQISQGVIKE